MTQLADQFKQKMRGLVGFPTTLSTSPTSNRGDGPLHSSSSTGEISVISKPAVLHEKVTTSEVAKTLSSSVCIGHGQILNAEEIQILAKIEEQNRLLEADTKSLKSVSSESGPLGASRRSSNGSVSPTTGSVNSNTSGCIDTGVSSSNNSTDVQVYNDKTWIYWGKIVNEWDEFKKKNGKQLKEMIRCGIPHHFRGLVWQLLCDGHNSPHKQRYPDLIKQTSPSEKLIRRDIARTYPDQEVFKEKEEVLFNVIKAYSLVDPEVGYCQGSAFIVGLLLMQMPEEEAFAVFVSLMQEYRLRELFKPSMAELGLCMYQLENLIQEHAPELTVHFQAQAFHTSMFASSWFLTLFATLFDLNLASRIMDVFISEGMEVIFRIGLGMLLGSKNKLLQLDMEGMIKYVQKDLTEFYNKDPDLLFKRAYSLVKYNAKKMKRIEKEYMTKKEREQEEQIEMRRLRTENRLLRQRVEDLENENGSLADKLIQDRVNRALEAEEKIIMGKELSIAKRQAMLNQSNSSSPATDVPNGESSDQKSPGKTDTEPFVVHLQQELVQSKLREAELADKILSLQDKVSDLSEKNRELNDQSKVRALQDELVAAKLREAESNCAMKELSHKLHNLEDNWQKHLSRTSASRRAMIHTKSSQNSKAALQEIQEELMSAKVRETKLIAQLADAKQKLMELETSSHINTSQLRRSEEERCTMKEKLRVNTDNERVLRQQLNETKTCLANLESKNQEALMTLRIREADNAMKIAEMEQTISSLKVKKLEDAEKHHYGKSAPLQHPDSTQIIHQLQRKVLKQQRLLDRLRKQTSSCDGVASSQDEDETASDISDDADLLFNATITADNLEEQNAFLDATESGDNSIYKNDLTSQSDLGSTLPGTSRTSVG